jgi:predicted phosphodiesterase
MIIIIGDTHGRWKDYKKILAQYPEKTSIQIGDMGAGFPGQPELLGLPENAFWFRGNHDSPQVAKAHPNYLGDFGGKVIDGMKVFWCGGAWSIDQKFRTPNYTWWEDEELSLEELEDARKAYLDFKPDVMLSHDTAIPFAERILAKHSITGDRRVYLNRTNLALTDMFRSFQPKVWICGHFHASVTEIIDGTKFICLDELEPYELKSV